MTKKPGDKKPGDKNQVTDGPLPTQEQRQLQRANHKPRKPGIADSNNSRIRKVTVATGVITTVAGNGTFGYSGDDSAATNAINASTGYLFPSLLVRGKVALMTRLARMVVSGFPHHVTQRGNRREPIFFEDGDQEIYRDLLGEQARKADVEVWAYCLMPNHAHPILNPRQADAVLLSDGYRCWLSMRGVATGPLQLGESTSERGKRVQAGRHSPTNTHRPAPGNCGVYSRS